MLMLAVQTMQAILKDVQMREQAHLIQREVAHLMADVGRLRDRVLNLQRHFGQAHTDIDEILTSSQKIASRGLKIETLDFADAQSAPQVERAEPSPRRGEAAARNGNGGDRQASLLPGE
jgi:DNA recombination protein RmuC